MSSQDTRNILSPAVLLTYLNPSKLMMMHVDAFLCGIRVMTYRMDNRSENLLCYISCMLTAAKRNSSTLKKED